ncbi:hypothetical protein J1614_005789, partial [Plenodomus biglobosus]
MSSSTCRSAKMNQPLYTCDIDAEPLHRYKDGGYHPIHLGEILHEGRYKILHKLGWGGYSTVWAARDQRSKALTVATNVLSSRSWGQAWRIISILILVARGSQQRQPVSSRSKFYKAYAVCMNMGLLTEVDLHIRNLAFTIPSMNEMSEETFIKKLGVPQLGPVKRGDQADPGPGLPQYIVRPTHYPLSRSLPSYLIKIVDYGQSFLDNDAPQLFHTPLYLRAPEIIFQDKVDYRMDLWSMGCMLFELFVGQPPFDSIMTTPAILAGQMLETTGEAMPHRWQKAWHAMESASLGEMSGQRIQDWLEEVYFDGDRREDLSRADVVRLGRIISSMLRLEPSARLSAREVLQDPWFQEG